MKIFHVWKKCLSVNTIKQYFELRKMKFNFFYFIKGKCQVFDCFVNHLDIFRGFFGAKKVFYFKNVFWTELYKKVYFEKYWIG